MDPLHHAFYARYLSAGDRAVSWGTASGLSGDDRLVLLIGELQMNVRNRGFAHYLATRGRQRAQSALRALAAVGATKTARVLSEALAVPPARLSALDGRFIHAGEDLPALTMRYMERREQRH